MPTPAKKLTKALKHFERREIKPKEYVERLEKPLPGKEPELVLGNGGKYHLREFIFLPVEEDGTRRYTTITRQNVNPVKISDELGWNMAKLDQKIAKAKEERATRNKELKEKLNLFLKAGIITTDDANQFILDREYGNINSLEEGYLLEKWYTKLDRVERDLARQQRDQEKETKETARLEKERGEQEAKEQERLEKYRSEWTPKSKTVSKVYAALKASRNQDGIADLDYNSIMEKTGIGSRSTVAKALAELKEAGRVKIAPQYHKSNGYFILD